MDDSILATVKKMLGIDEAYLPFDTDIILFINSALMTLHQRGVGPDEGLSISDYTTTWSELLKDNGVMLRATQEYVYMKVKMVFDPPGNSFVMTAMQERCKEIEQRLVMQAESVKDFHFVDKENNPRL